MDSAAPATKADVDDVLAVLRDIMQIMSDIASRHDNQLAALQAEQQAQRSELHAFQQDTTATLTRIENKLTPTIDQVDNHEGRLRRLELGQQAT